MKEFQQTTKFINVISKMSHMSYGKNMIEHYHTEIKKK